MCSMTWAVAMGAFPLWRRARTASRRWARRTTMEETQFAVLPVAKSGIRRIDIDPDRSQSPTFGGLSFGSVGQYEKLRGTAYGELDPADLRKAVITDIHLEPDNDRDMVE